MANKDIIVSTEQGTILNYFGVANTYDPFTNQSKLQKIEDLNFNIPELPPFDLAEFVAVSTGLLATSLSFLNYCEFSILDKNTGAKITDLKNNIGEIGNTSFYPSENQIFWFNRDGLRGTFYLNKAHAGKVLHITSGMFSTTSITSGVLNDMFARTTGVPKYIEDINKSIANLNTRITNLRKEIRITPYSIQCANHSVVQVPSNFLGGVVVFIYLKKDWGQADFKYSAEIYYGDRGQPGFSNPILLGSGSISKREPLAYYFLHTRMPVAAGGTFRVDINTKLYPLWPPVIYDQNIVLDGSLINI